MLYQHRMMQKIKKLKSSPTLHWFNEHMKSGETQRRYDTRASIRLIASAITLSVGVIMPRLSAHAQHC